MSQPLDKIMERLNSPVLYLCITLLVIATFYMVSALNGVDGHTAPPQIDSVLYMQYARAFAEGHPYRYTATDDPSTASTSHLYPLLLSVPYFLGAKGEALLTVGFLFDVLFRLAFIAFFWLVARKLVPRSAILATLLVALNGHLTSITLDQSDMGLFVMLNFGTLAAALYGRKKLMGLGLILCAWCRPEGVLLSGFLVIISLWKVLRSDRTFRPYIWLASAGLLSTALVFLLNFALTGTWQFLSVIDKGYLQHYSLPGAILNGLKDLALMVQQILFNVAGHPRHGYFFPILGGLLAIFGFVSMKRSSPQTAAMEACWVLSALAALVLVAFSQWQGANMDRYLAPILPLWYMYAACGVTYLASLVSGPLVARGLAVMLIGYELLFLPYFVSVHGHRCMFAQSQIEFLKEVDQTLPAEETLGGISSTIQFFAPQREVTHVQGFTSPFFARSRRHYRCNVELLKHHPELRFDYWLLDRNNIKGFVQPALLGRMMLADSRTFGARHLGAVFETDWSTFDPRGNLPLDANICAEIKDMTLMDQLDVGYAKDEQRCGYGFTTRVPQLRLPPLVTTYRLNNITLTEVGQPIIGSDTFTMKTVPGKPVKLVLRVAERCPGNLTRSDIAKYDYPFEFARTGHFLPIVNGQSAPACRYKLSGRPDEFSEVMLEIPASFITSKETLLTIQGDRVVFGYWCYQTTD